MKFVERFITGRIRSLLCSAQPEPGGSETTGGDHVPPGGGGTPPVGTGGDVAIQTPMQVQQARVGAVLHTIPVPVPVPGQPVNGPTFPILSGYYVEVSPIPGNVGNAFFSRVSRQAAVSGPREQVANNAVPRQIDVRDLSELWINAANANEGVQFTIRRTGL